MAKKAFDVMKALRDEAARDPEFAAMVDAELAALDLEEKIVALRKRTHLTQAGVAARMGVSQSAVAQLEKKGAAAKMELRTLAKMAAATGYTLKVGFEKRRARKADLEPAHGR